MSNTMLPNISQSLELLGRAEGLIPSSTQTLAKGPAQHVRGVAPVYAQRGKGGHIWDVDGNEYIDYTMGVGPLILGYTHPIVDSAVAEQLRDGITFSLMHPLEVEVAELIRSVIPNAERVRFSKTGCDVTTAAVRLARAYTGKETVLCCGYHGWHDWYISVTDRNNGIPASTQDLTYTFNYNNIQSVIDAIDDTTAAIILEPIVFDEPENNFLHELRRICTERNIVLIFDEMWTGFRLALGGAQEYFGITADLACYSKAIANGMPISVLTGKAAIMDLLDKDVFFYTTFGGEALSLAAAKATIQYLQAHDVTKSIFEKGALLRDGYNAIAQKNRMPYTLCKGYACRSIITFDASVASPLIMKSFVQQELIRDGILWGGFHNMCYMHTEEDITRTLIAYERILPMLNEAIIDGSLEELLVGNPVQAVFRKTSNFNTKPKIAREVV